MQRKEKDNRPLRRLVVYSLKCRIVHPALYAVENAPQRAVLSYILCIPVLIAYPCAGSLCLLLGIIHLLRRLAFALLRPHNAS